MELMAGGVTGSASTVGATSLAGIARGVVGEAYCIACAIADTLGAWAG
jgi:hypothetical protein